MEKKYNILNEFEELTPKLSEIKKENAFSVPEQYFEEFSAKLITKLNVNKDKKKKLNIVYFLQQTQYAIAASLIIVLMISGVYFYRTKTIQTAQNNNVYWDEVLNDNTIIDKVDESLLVETYIEETTTNKDISEDEITDYIDNEYNNDIFNEL